MALSKAKRDELEDIKAIESQKMRTEITSADLKSGDTLMGKGYSYTLDLGRGTGGFKVFTTGGRQALQWSEQDGEYTARAAEFRLKDGRRAFGVVILDLSSSGEHESTLIVLKDGEIVQQSDAAFDEKIGGEVFGYNYRYAGTCDDIHIHKDGPNQGWSNNGELATLKGTTMTATKKQTPEQIAIDATEKRASAKKNPATKKSSPKKNGKTPAAATKKAPAKKAQKKSDAPTKPPTAPAGKRERDRPTNQVVIAMGNAVVDYLANQSPTNQKTLAAALNVIQDQWPAFRRATTDSK